MFEFLVILGVFGGFFGLIGLMFLNFLRKERKLRNNPHVMTEDQYQHFNEQRFRR